MELHDSLHHANSLVEGTVVVMLREGVLLEELVLDDLGSSEDSFLIFGQRVLSDKLHDFCQLIFLLKHLLEAFTEYHEFWVDFGVVLTENTIVVGETDVPVH